MVLKSIVIVSIDDEERKQHYEEIKNDLDIAEDNMDTLVSGKSEPLSFKFIIVHMMYCEIKCIFSRLLITYNDCYYIVGMISSIPYKTNYIHTINVHSILQLINVSML